jgi:hypothetical protein
VLINRASCQVSNPATENINARHATKAKITESGEYPFPWPDNPPSMINEAIKPMRLNAAIAQTIPETPERGK